MRRDDAGALILLALCVAALLARLADVPAMTSDESWMGIFALRVLARGVDSVHEMNRYTGPLYGVVVSGFLSAFGTSIASLRAFGALCNAGALIATWAHLRRRISPQAGAFWLLLAAGSAYWLMKSRLAWEVYALQPLLVCAVAAVVAGAEKRAAPLALAALCWLGVQNHFIFLCVPASLVLMFAARAAWLDEAAAVPGLRASTAGLAAAAVLAALKYRVSDEFWDAHRVLVAAGLLAAPATAAALVLAAPATAWKRALDVLAAPAARRLGTILTGAGLLAFGVWHLIPMIQILAGPVVFKRVFSWPPPLALSLCWHLWALFLCAAIIWNSVRAWHDGSLSTHQRTLLLWPAALGAVFIVLRNTSSLRYYCLPVWISLMALGVGFALLAEADKRAAALCAAAAMLATQGLLWREILAPVDRRPLEFRIGWHRDNSWDFARKDALYEALDQTRACTASSDEPGWAQGPLTFHHAARLSPCDHSVVLRVRPLPEAAAPPFFQWWLVPSKS